MWSRYRCGTGTCVEQVHVWSRYRCGAGTGVEQVQVWSRYNFGAGTGEEQKQVQVKSRNRCPAGVQQGQTGEEQEQESCRCAAVTGVEHVQVCSRYRHAAGKVWVCIRCRCAAGVGVQQVWVCNRYAAGSRVQQVLMQKNITIYPFEIFDLLFIKYLY